MIYAAGALALGLIYLGWFIFGKANRLTRHAKGWRILIQVTLTVLFTILSVPSVDALVNRLIPFFSLSSIAKVLFVLPLCDLHMRVLVDSNVRDWSSVRSLYLFAPVGCIALSLYALVAYERRISPSSQEYIIRGCRDLLLITFIISGFIQAHIHMYQQEKVLPMRLKQGVQVLFLSFIAPLYVAGSIAQLIIALVNIPAAIPPYDLVRPIGIVASLVFCLVLLPHRAYLPVALAYRMWLYLHLRRVQDAISRWTGIKVVRVYPGRGLPLRLEYMELLIYQTLIFILDYFRELPFAKAEHASDATTLYARVFQVVEREGDSETLVRAIARIGV